MTTEKPVEKTFRLTPEEDAKVDQLIRYAHLAGVIKKPTFQEYMIFALNCAFANLKDGFLKGR